jgi:primosomal protein N' (replication factor Y)
MVYPPYCDMCSVLFVSENEIKALNASRDFLSELKRTTAEEYRDVKIIVLGPMPPRVSKMNNKFRYRIIIKCKNNKRFRKMLSDMLISFGKNKKYSDVSFVADINPENLI